jgi:two-component system response regulator PilR (NtrC family)
VGGDEDHAVDARILTATNQDLQRLIQEKRFREDLYYRINVITIQLPGLKDRREDIPLLAHHFLEKYARIWGKQVPVLTRDALKALERYAWPGNVRELENVMERAMALCQDDRILAHNLPDEVMGFRPAAGPSDVEIPESGFKLTETLEAVRTAYILKALELENGIMMRAAERLGITFRSMRYFVKKYRLQAREG